MNKQDKKVDTGKIFWLFQGGYSNLDNKIATDAPFQSVGRVLPRRLEGVYDNKIIAVLSPQESDLGLMRSLCIVPGDTMFLIYLPSETLLRKLAYRIYPVADNPRSRLYGTQTNNKGMSVALVMARIAIDSYNCAFQTYIDQGDNMLVKGHELIKMDEYHFHVLNMDNVVKSNEGILIGFKYLSPAVSGVAFNDASFRVEMFADYRFYDAPKHTY